MQEKRRKKSKIAKNVFYLSRKTITQYMMNDIKMNENKMCKQSLQSVQDFFIAFTFRFWNENNNKYYVKKTNLVIKQNTDMKSDCRSMIVKI